MGKTSTKLEFRNKELAYIKVSFGSKKYFLKSEHRLEYRAQVSNTIKETAESGQEVQSELDDFFDVRKVLKLQETELKYNDLLYELDVLKTDNVQLQGSVTKE